MKKSRGLLQAVIFRTAQKSESLKTRRDGFVW